MSIKNFSSASGLIWFLVLMFSCWGGVVRYLIDVQRSKRRWSWFGLVMQTTISSFTGMMGGLVAIENGNTVNISFVAAGIAGALGSYVIGFIWRRIINKLEKFNV